MKFSVLTLFPQMFEDPFSYSIIKRALTQKILKLNIINIRDSAADKYKTVDDKPYGGGSGMILKIDTIVKALDNLKLKTSNKKQEERIILLDPRGTRYMQKDAERLSKYEHVILICGHYEGVDERINHFIDEKLSLGDFILTGGEIGAMAIIDSVCRLLPEVIKKESLKTESRPPEYLEYPQYTRPEVFRNLKVPKVLLSGNHKKIDLWRKANAISH